MAKLFLTGYMGSGKSTLGTTLASKMEYEFIDLDNFIVKENHMSIPEIFSTKGESEFRAMENNALKKILQKDDIVVACGGGTPCYYNNMELMKNNGVTVYIKMSVDSLFSRLSVDKDQRPLIANKTDDELKAFIARQLEKREDFYQQAQYVVKGKNLDVDELASFVKEEVGL